jgi:Predicted amidophosphoribosyltransferases
VIVNVKPSLLQSLIALFYPSLCVVCGEPLAGQEQHLCLPCSLRLPQTGYNPTEDNPTRDAFRGKVPLEKAWSYLYYNKDGVGKNIVSEIKYKGNVRLGEYIGRRMAHELMALCFFSDIDYLIPVPLHRSKQRKRGFNQAEVIAKGMASVCPVPVDTSLVRRKANSSQTRKGVYERWMNTQELFVLKEKERFASGHLLFIDDVLTTGATLFSTIEPFLGIEDIKISVLTLAIAK